MDYKFKIQRVVKIMDEKFAESKAPVSYLIGDYSNSDQTLVREKALEYAQLVYKYNHLVYPNRVLVIESFNPSHVQLCVWQPGTGGKVYV